MTERLLVQVRYEIRNLEVGKEIERKGVTQKTVLTGGTEASYGILGWSPVSLGSVTTTSIINIVLANRNNMVEVWPWLSTLLWQAGATRTKLL